MVDVINYISSLCKTLNASFGERVMFVGLQGSYGRDEAGPNSDIDAVVILDTLMPEDLRTYDAILNELPHRELACGFISGKDELLHWDAADLFQFYHDTTPVIGSLDFLLPILGADAAERAVATGACAIYHACVHNLLHEKDPEILRGLYKSAVFIVQAVHCCRTGQYVRRHNDLLSVVSEPERTILQTALAVKYNKTMPAEQFIPLSDVLFQWTQALIQKGVSEDG